MKLLIYFHNIYKYSRVRNIISFDNKNKLQQFIPLIANADKQKISNIEVKFR